MGTLSEGLASAAKQFEQASVSNLDLYEKSCRLWTFISCLEDLKVPGIEGYIIPSEEILFAGKKIKIKFKSYNYYLTLPGLEKPKRFKYMYTLARFLKEYHGKDSGNEEDV